MLWPDSAKRRSVSWLSGKPMEGAIWRVSSYCSSSQGLEKSHHLALLKMASNPAAAVWRVWSG